LSSASPCHSPNMLPVGLLVVSLLAQCSATASLPTDQQWEDKVDEKGRKVQSLKIEAPAMTEEDQYGYTMPDQYRCDACKVVSFHLSEALKLRQPKNRRLQEWEYQDIYDETCKSGLAGYGIALVNGENVLSGPALKRDHLSPGMGSIQMGGETWEKRLGEICRKLVYDKIGEDELYEHFRRQGEISADLCYKETRDCRLGPNPVRKTEKASKTPAAKKEKKPDAGIDIDTFVRKLAKKHGVPKDDYTRKRSFAEWERLFAQIAERVSEVGNKQMGQIVDV